MSLKVAPALLEKARDGKVGDAEFLDCIRASLPYAWDMVARLVGELRDGDARWTGNREVPQTDAQWGEMFRMMASNAMRDAVERHYGVRLAFQNCCRVAVFEPDATQAYDRFVSAEAQLLNQHPELTNC